MYNYVVVQFYPWFNILLFLCMVMYMYMYMYDNELKTKSNCIN